MEQYFTTIAENEFKKDLFLHPLAYSIKPYQSMTDCLSTIISPIILPGYFLTLAIFSLIESILSTMYLCYLFIGNSDTKQDITEHTSSAKIGFQMLCACFIIAPLMAVVCLLRLVSTLIFDLIHSLDDPLEEQRASLKREKLITEAIGKYAALCTKVKSDRNLILEAFRSYNSEANTCLVQKPIKQYTDKKYQDIVKSLYFQANDDQVNLLRQKNTNDEMLQNFQELIDGYPNSSFGNPVTLEAVELSFVEFEEHHNKVLNLVDVLFPSMFALLHECKKVEVSSFMDLATGRQNV